MPERLMGLLRRFQFARRVPGRSPLEIVWFDLGRFAVASILTILYRFRVVGRERIPERGPVLLVCNHVSFLDPMVVGSGMKDRQFSPMARDSLFRFKPFGWLLRSYGCIPIRREGGDAAAMRAALAELESGRCVVVFPEGTRSPDGSMQPFRRGVLLLLKRAKATVLPMGVAGTFEAWPKGRRPRLCGRIRLAVGTPIPSEELLNVSNDEALARLEREVAGQVARAAAARAGK
jgi:1-acyl-sn-glycerol-3-phosphate acyltransferase